MSLVIRATNKNGVVADLDLRQDVDLLLDISAIENTDIGRVFGVSTQTFALPDTSTNNQFFGNLFNLGATPSVALEDSIDAQLLQDGAEVMKGKLYIVDIVTNQKGKTFYNVNLVNETIDFKFKIENADNPFLSGLDWSEYNHSYTHNSVTGSWYNDVLEGASASYPTGSIIYPHVNYGITPDSSEPQYAFGGQVGKIDNSSSPLQTLDFKPAIRTKDVIDKIFDSVDYTYSSSFFNSDFFKNLYILPSNTEEKGVTTNPITGSVQAYKSPNQDITAPLANIPVQITFDQETFDNGNRWNTGTSRFTANSDGLHKFATFLTYQFLNITVPSGISRTLTLEFWVNGVPYSQQYVPIAPEYGQIFLQANIPLVAGDYVEVYLTPYSSNAVEYLRIYGSVTNTYFLAETPFSTLGTNVDMGAQFPNELKMLDFLSALIEKFNLVIEPDRTERNLLIIEPYNTWLDLGVVKDWTDKVDRNVDFKIVHPITEQPKTIYFSDEEDDDILTQYTLQNYNRIYGDFTYSTESDLANGERKIGKIFGPCPVKGIDGGGQFVIPHMCRKEANEEPRPFRFKPRLIQAIGLQSASLDAQGYDQDTSTANPGNYWMRDESTSTNVLKPLYYAVGALSSVNNNFNSDTSLHFDTLQHYDYQEPYANGHVLNSAFQQYWAQYLNSELYDIDSRKLTCNIYLKPTEYFDFQLNDNIFIDGAYYRINKISGGNLSKRESVEVELIKILKRRLSYPRRTLTNGAVIVAEPLSYDVNGSVIIYNDTTGEPISGSVIGGYANQLGLATYPIGGGNVQAVWNFRGGSNIEPSARVSGNNNVSQGTTNTLIMGNANTVESSTNGIVVGDQNRVNQLSNNVTAIGNNHSVARQSDNVQIIGGVSNYTTGSNTNLAIIGGTGSYADNTDYSAIINGTNAGLRDSDVTTLITPHNQEVVINGNGHTVVGLNREGVGLDLLNTRANTNWLGDTYLGGAIFRDKVQLEVGDGTFISLTGSAYGSGRHENLYILNWSGLSPGTATIELPNAVNNDYKGIVYQFVSNGTPSAGTGDTVEIVGFGGQLINGSPSYKLVGRYSGVTLTTSGSQWLGLASKTASGQAAGSYGSFYSDADQALVSTTAAQAVTLNGTFASSSVSISGSSAIVFEYAGTYQLSYIVQVSSLSSAQEDSYFWVRYNGVDFANSTTNISLQPRKSAGVPSTQLMTVTLTGEALNDGDYIELYWSGTSLDVSLDSFPTGSSPTRPATPSVIANIIHVG